MIAMVTPWLFLIVYYGAPMLNSQRRHLLAVEDHIVAIAPQWVAWCSGQGTRTNLNVLNIGP